jgi:hypothetical protein
MEWLGITHFAWLCSHAANRLAGLDRRVRPRRLETHDAYWASVVLVLSHYR